MAHDGSVAQPGRPPIPPQLCVVSPEHIDLLWPQIEPMLESATATSRGRETAFDVRRALMARDAQLFVWWEGGRVEVLAVVEIVRHPRKTIGRIKICTAIPGAVTRETFRICTTIIESWCKEQGATGMAMDARPGWARVLRSLGYETTHYFLEKELADG